MVGLERLELSRVAPLEPKSSASTNFATTPDLLRHLVLMVRIIMIFSRLASIF